VAVIAVGVLLTSTVDFVNAMRDVRYPLWGEARILRKLTTPADKLGQDSLYSLWPLVFGAITSARIDRFAPGNVTTFSFK